MAGTHKGDSTATKSGAGKSRRARGRKKVVKAAGAAIGIGSAALVAALLYANRSREEPAAPANDPRFEPGEA